MRVSSLRAVSSPASSTPHVHQTQHLGPGKSWSLCRGGHISFLSGLLRTSLQLARMRGSDSESCRLKTFEIRSTVVWYWCSSTHLEVKAAPYTMSDFLRTRLVEFV